MIWHDVEVNSSRLIQNGRRRRTRREDVNDQGCGDGPTGTIHHAAGSTPTLRILMNYKIWYPNSWMVFKGKYLKIRFLFSNGWYCNHLEPTTWGWLGTARAISANDWGSCFYFDSPHVQMIYFPAGSWWKRSQTAYMAKATGSGTARDAIDKLSVARSCCNG